ncbi:unnamed protein product [Plutella xylostella]|uniref:(diamondback moth) hypothetical protein n=1 Tax=Plutella xylostella TaxID=51655 RepID=A0A8S4G3P1_PLUXY|nr:unnamed protein product [Plutella xylostella]
MHRLWLDSGREQYQWVPAPPATLAGLRAAASYAVRVGEPDGAFSSEVCSPSSAPGPVATLAGLRAAASYAVRVGEPDGAFSSEVIVHTPSDVPAAAPLNVTAAATGATSILVSWEAPPPRSHRGPLTGYKLRYRPAPPAAPAPGRKRAETLTTPADARRAELRGLERDTNYQRVVYKLRYRPAPPASPAPGRKRAETLTTPADVRRAELRGLERDTNYQIRVCAINVNGSGPFSEWVSAATRRDLSQPSVPPPPPPLTTRAGRDWISVWWGALSGGGALGLALGWGRGVPDEQSRSLPPASHSHVIRDLQPDSEYVISLRASNKLGLGPPVYATVRTLPAAAGEGDDEPDDELDEEEEEEPPALIPPLGVKVRGAGGQGGGEEEEEEEPPALKPLLGVKVRGAGGQGGGEEEEEEEPPALKPPLGVKVRGRGDRGGRGGGGGAARADTPAGGQGEGGRGDRGGERHCLKAI